MLRHPLHAVDSNLFSLPSKKKNSDKNNIIEEKEKTSLKEKRRKKNNWAYSFAQLSLRHNHLGLSFQKTTETQMDQSLNKLDNEAKEISTFQRQFLQSQITQKNFEWYQSTFSICSTTLAALSSAYLVMGGSYFVAGALIFSGLSSLANEILTKTGSLDSIAGYITSDEKQKMMYASSIKTLIATSSLFISVCAGGYGYFQIMQNIKNPIILQALVQATNMSSFISGAGSDIYEKKVFTTKADLKQAQSDQAKTFLSYDSAAKNLEHQLQHQLNMHQMESLFLNEYVQAQRIASSGV